MRGTMTIPNQFFKQRVIPVPAVRVKGNHISLLGAPGNWISMDFDMDKETISGSWRFGPIKGDLKGARHR